jgi:membrane protein
MGTITYDEPAYDDPAHDDPAYDDPGDIAERDRGRDARRPTDIPSRGWLDIALRVKKEIAKDNVSLIASGLALYALLAAFPALAAAVSIYGLFASPDDIAQQMQQFAGFLPADGQQILQRQLQQLASHNSDTLSIGLALGILIALWSARKGMVALMAATNVAYDEREERGFFRQILVSLAFTVGAIIAFLAVLLLGVAVPLILKALPLGPATEFIILIARWVLLWLIAVTGLAIVYRYAPDRKEPQWKWVTWGSAIAATLWLIGSVLFAIYVRNSGTFGQTYGALGGVVVLLMWLYLSGYIIVLGAEINSEMERQTVKDTTINEDAPLGQRGAYAADTVGESRPQSAEQQPRTLTMASKNPPAPTATIDALTVLERDHRLVERFFADFHAAAPQQLDPIGRRICKMLRIHTRIEEEIFYPAARTALGDEAWIDRAEREHAEAKEAITAVESRTSDAADYTDAVHRLQGLIEAHVREEEGELFPKLRETNLNLDMLALALLDRRNTLMEVMGLHGDDENSATPEPPRLGEATERTAPSRPDR